MCTADVVQACLGRELELLSVSRWAAMYKGVVSPQGFDMRGCPIGIEARALVWGPV